MFKNTIQDKRHSPLTRLLSAVTALAKAFVRKTFGDDCQVVIATHTDRGHIHSHILVNTYTLTGRRLNANKTTLDRVKEYSDRVCLAFGIQPYDKSKGKTVSYHEWEKRRQGVKIKYLNKVFSNQTFALPINIHSIFVQW